MVEGRKDGLRDVCAQMHDDDGVDPRHERRRQDRTNDVKLQRKDAQLAKFAFLAAEHLLAGRGDTPAWGAVVLDAEVRGSGSHVLVRVCFPGGVERRAAETWLAAMATGVRTELARRLNRRRTPSVRLQWAGEFPGEFTENTNEHERR